MAENIELYESSYTAEQLEHAIKAVPHIGENGNWWVGDIDTGVRANSVDVSGCQVGDCIVVKRIDENGTPTAWEPASKRNVGRGKIVTIIDHTFTEDLADATADWGIEDALLGGYHVWFNDVDGDPLKLRRIWFSIYWGDGSKEAITTFSGVYLSRRTGNNEYQGWNIGDDARLLNSRGSTGNSIVNKYYFMGMNDYDTMRVDSIVLGNEDWYTQSPYGTSFSDRNKISKWSYADLVKLYFVGTIKAGTRIKVYGEMIE